MSRAWQIDRQLQREEDRLVDLLNRGEISREEYNAEMREITSAAREAYEAEREEALRRVDDEWGRW